MASYIWLCLGKKKGLNPLDSSLYLLKLGIFCHVLLGIWWRWRQLNKINKLLFINNKNIIKKLGIQTGIQIMCCWAVFLVGFGGEKGSSTQDLNSLARARFIDYCLTV